MNVIVKDNIIHKFEGIMRYNENISKYDYDYMHNIFPYPTENPKYNTKKILIKLIEVENILESQNKFKKYDKTKSCPLCGLKNVSTIIYNLSNLHWDDGLKHFIGQHYYKPSDDFLHIIEHSKIKNNEIIHDTEIKHNSEKEKVLFRMAGLIIKREKKTYVRISRNQIRILDALMNDGGYEKKYYDSTNNLRWSEHAGLLDFSKNKLDKIIVSGKTIRTDKDDHEIFLPLNMIEAYNYEYMFHTHPPTPNEGYRAKQGIVYEFPSISDIFHFIEHYNNGNIQGSLVIAPEGIYIIQTTNIDIDDKIIINDENKVFEELTNIQFEIQTLALEKYGKNITKDIFYNQVIKDNKYIKMFNKALKKYNIKILYKPRELKNNKWIINGLSIKVNPIKPIKI
jgi:hypothetical protein